MGETPDRNPDLVQAEYENKMKREREGIVDKLREELLAALAELDKVKTEMVGGNLEIAWQSMAKVENLALGINITAEKFRIRLRQQSEK